MTFLEKRPFSGPTNINELNTWNKQHFLGKALLTGRPPKLIDRKYYTRESDKDQQMVLLLGVTYYKCHAFSIRFLKILMFGKYRLILIAQYSTFK